MEPRVNPDGTFPYKALYSEYLKIKINLDHLTQYKLTGLLLDHTSSFTI